LQNNVDEAVAKLKAEGLDVFGLACHVSLADQRANLIKSAVDVRF
jgi:dehydrogenase/reductase SDR family protein 4